MAPKRRAGPESTLVGHTIEGKYQLTAILGRGGMGTVYDATHRLTNRKVAVKILLQEQAEKPDAIARFQHEARVVSGLGHPNICEILDFGRLEDGRPFLVMERLEGETLGQVLDRRVNLEAGEAVSIVRQVLGALGAAHERGVIHRDMKPDNVFLLTHAVGPPAAKVLDFGISKAMYDDREVELTRTGMVMGTPYYMAPEQARGDRNLDGRVDVWAVGVLLYEAATGARPFVAKNYNALLVEILTARQRPAVERNAKVPAALSAVIDRALAKRREDRFATVEEMSSALAPFERVPAPKVIQRPKLDRFVELGGDRIPVTWEDTGGTPPSDGGARVFDARALGLPLPPKSAPATAPAAAPPLAAAPPRAAAPPPAARAPAGPPPAGPPPAGAPPAGSPPAGSPPAGSPPPMEGRAEGGSEGAGARRGSVQPLALGAPVAQPQLGGAPATRAPSASRGTESPWPAPAAASPSPTAASRPGVGAPALPPRPGPRPDPARGGFQPAPPPAPRRESVAEAPRTGTGSAGLRQSAAFRARGREGATSKPPIIEDEDTTKVLLDADSVEPVTPPIPGQGWRGAGGATPPAPPHGGPWARVPGPARSRASSRPPMDASAEDLESTIVDTDPPTFSSDAYRAHREKKE